MPTAEPPIIKDDPNRIPALCIHEDSATKSLSLIMEMGLHVCRASSRDLRKYSNHYRKSKNVTNNAEDEIFSAIVAMCSGRILSRMRLVKHKRGQPRQTINALLQETVNLLGAQFPDFRRSAQTVIKLLNLWTKHQTEQRLCNVVDAVLQLSCTNDLPRLLGSIPNRRMGPSERTNLLKMVKRVGRYREAARFLCQLAKKHIVARKMTTILVSLPKSAFFQPSREYSPDLLSVFAKLEMTGSQYNLNHISYILSKNGALAENLFAKQCTETLIKGKVHAEVQLVYYCETIKPFPLPRVIASSKMACFLCNAFICQMTKFYTTRCWKIPVFPFSNDLERRFTQTLETQVKLSIKTLLSRQKRTAYPQPSESTLWTMKSLETTINLAAEDDKSHRDRAILLDSDAELTCTGTAVITLQPEPNTNCELETTLEIDMDANSTSGVEEEASLVKSFIPSTPQVSTLQRGKPISTAVRAGHSSSFFESQPLRLQIEYEIGPNYDKKEKGETELNCSIEWLTQKDAELIKDDDHWMAHCPSQSEIKTAFISPLDFANHSLGTLFRTQGFPHLLGLSWKKSILQSRHDGGFHRCLFHLLLTELSAFVGKNDPSLSSDIIIKGVEVARLQNQ
ncbi:nucleic acid/nucleotide deaminase superfamily protein [Hirsutella rhossiliensis]